MRKINNILLMKSSHGLTDLGEWSPFPIYQQRCRSGNGIYRIQYTLPNNDILTEKLMNIGLKCDYPWGRLFSDDQPP